MMKAFKVERFEGEPGERTADITVDGKMVGWIEAVYTGDWKSATSRQMVERVGGYGVYISDPDLSAKAEALNVACDADVATRGEATKWLTKFFAAVAS